MFLVLVNYNTDRYIEFDWIMIELICRTLTTLLTHPHLQDLSMFVLDNYWMFVLYEDYLNFCKEKWYNSYKHVMWIIDSLSTVKSGWWKCQFKSISSFNFCDDGTIPYQPKRVGTNLVDTKYSWLVHNINFVYQL